ncbi:MAG: hypothetical protein HQL32_04420 [Planctomycetes bacterium]|nr:hypothetical protein [Planctomycetota bacterium]
MSLNNNDDAPLSKEMIDALHELKVSGELKRSVLAKAQSAWENSEDDNNEDDVYWLGPIIKLASCILFAFMAPWLVSAITQPSFSQMPVKINKSVKVDIDEESSLQLAYSEIGRLITRRASAKVMINYFEHLKKN